jgi:hypothetical protein
LLLAENALVADATSPSAAAFPAEFKKSRLSWENAIVRLMLPGLVASRYEAA